MSDRYGAHSWAVVTGGSEGIGLAIAKKLAQQGFNIVIIARSTEKLRIAREEILKENQLADVLTLSMDFSNSDKAEFFKEIESKKAWISVFW